MAFYSKCQSEHFVDNIQQETNNETILCSQEAPQSRQHSSRRSSLEFFDTIDIGFELLKTNDEDEEQEDDFPVVERNFKRSVISDDETLETQEISYEGRHDVTNSSNILVLDTPDDHPRLVGSANDDHQDQCIMKRFINGTSRSRKTIASAKVQELALETLMSMLGPDFDLLHVGLECQLKSLKGEGEIEFLQTIRHTCSDNHNSSTRLIYLQLKEEHCECEGTTSCLFSILFGFSSFCGYCTTSVKGVCIVIDLTTQEGKEYARGLLQREISNSLHMLEECLSCGGSTITNES